jgi:hypothetical protein
MQGENSGLDRELDSALKTYAAVEPRAGLEQRVLANLRGKRRSRAARGARGGVVFAVVAMAVAIAVVSLTWLTRSRSFDLAKSQRASRGEIANQPSPMATARDDVRTHESKSAGLREHVQSAPYAKTDKVKTVAACERPRTVTLGEAVPKLEQFPAPEPLSEQEKLLVRFVQGNPKKAALVAEAWAEQLRRDDEETRKFLEGAERGQQER